MATKLATAVPAPAHGATPLVGPAHKPRLEISLFGGVSLRYGGARIELNNRKAMALVGYLALAANLSDTRERIVGLLWSETEEAKARATLRQVLKDLRTSFDQCRFSGFTTGRVEVGIDAAEVTLDVWSVLESAAAGRPNELLLDRSRITETLLAGYEDVDPSFRAWLFVCRENLHRRLIRGLEDQLASDAPTSAEIMRLAQAIIQLDPTHEIAVQRLIRCHADAGDMAGALSAHKRLWDLLDTDYDMEPSDKTQDLISGIKAGTYVPSPPIAPKAATNAGRVNSSSKAVQKLAYRGTNQTSPPKLVLVVGPCEVDGVQPDQKYIGIGFRYELITRLVRFREWTLIDAATATAPHPAAQNSDLQPQYLVTARFFQNEGHLSLIVTLQASQTGVIVWSGRYALAPANFFETQQEVLHRIANVLNVNLSAERLVRMASAPDVSLDVYDRWLRGQGLINLYRPNDHARAAAIFQALVEEVPNMSLAYSSLVQVENTRHITFPGTYRTIALHQNALALARTAVNLDPIDSRAQLCLAWSFAFTGQFDMAVACFRHAIALNDDDPWTTTSAALGLAYSDQRDEARHFADRAVALSPVASPLHWCYQSTIRFICEDYDASLRAAEQSGEAINYFQGWRAAALAHAGRLTEAHSEGQRFLSVIRRFWSGPDQPSDTTISHWLLHCFPIRNPEAVERLRKGLALAGVLVP